MRLYELEYPLADFDRDGWYGNGTYKQDGGRIIWMKPDEYLSQVRPLTLDDVSEENIADLMQHIKDGGKLDPLVIYRDGKEDGRHRAYAAMRLGITKVPVIVFK